MSEVESLSQRWTSYRPTKTLWFWSVVGTAILVMIIGFTVGGWTTEGNAAFMAEQAARKARAELAAAVCVNKFVSAENAAQNLTKLKNASYWQRDDFVEEGGWVKVAGMDDIVPGATDLCVERLVAMESLPATSSQVAPATSDG